MRTSDNYTADQMYADHLDSLRMSGVQSDESEVVKYWIIEGVSDEAK